MADRLVTKAEIFAMQKALAGMGFDPGPLDGVFGPKTAAAVKQAQALLGYPLTGRPTYEFLVELRVIAPPVKAKKSSPISDFITGLVVKAVVSKLKGLPAMNILSGYKTYILAILIVLCALAETFVGVDIPEFNMGLGEAIAVGLALITGRAGAKADVAKIQ